MKSKKPNIKHVAFDWSGTLFDDHPVSFMAIQTLIHKLTGKNVSLKEYKNEFTIPVHDFYLKHGITLPFDEIDRLYFEEFSHRVNQCDLFKGVREILEFLHKQGISISVFSTVEKSLLKSQCERLGLKKYFRFIQGSVQNKILEMPMHLKKCEVAPEDTLYIGDMDHDVHAANENGILSGCIVNGYHEVKRLLQSRPRFVWNHQQEWLPFFKSLTQDFPEPKEFAHPIPTSGSLVVNDKNQVLLVLSAKWSHTYGIPGGKIEVGETAKQAAIREIKEETGLDTHDLKLIMVQDCIHPHEFYNPKAHFILFNYVARCDSTTIILNDECQSHLWVDAEEAAFLCLNEPTRVLLESLDFTCFAQVEVRNL